MKSVTTIEGGRIPQAFAGRGRSSMLDAARANVQASYPVLSIRGRAWRLKMGGEESVIKDDRNQAVQSLEVVIVGVASHISKTYYADGYVQGADNRPDCQSIDGVKPDVGVPHKQNSVCSTCRQNQRGAKVSAAGKPVKACADQRCIAVVPAVNITGEAGPMLLRVPTMSLRNLANYSLFLDQKGADFPYVVTTLGFDGDVSYPRITFSAVRFLDDEEANDVLDVLEHPAIEQMLNEAVPSTSSSADEGDDARVESSKPEPLSQGRPSGVFGGAKAPARGSSVVPMRPPVVTEPDPEPRPSKAAIGAASAFTTSSKANGKAQPETVEDEEPGIDPNRGQLGTVKAEAPVEATPAKSQASKPRKGNLPAALPQAPPDLESAIDDLLDDN